MESSPKTTRNCIEPWRSVQFEAGGGISPCCSGTLTGNYGNMFTDYFEAIEAGRPTDIFANDDYRALRQGLLTGDLAPSCRSCRMVHDADISTGELRQRVLNHLGIPDDASLDVDLTRAHAFHECGGNITNRCNFSCLYCSHSGEGGHAGFYRAEIGRQPFVDWIGFLHRQGLRIFNFCGIGELTVYPQWEELCSELLNRHPDLRLRAISNFGRTLTETELEVLSRFDLIHISCDTLDEDTYAWLRKGGRLPVLLNNLERLRARFTGDSARDPKLAFNVTVTDAIVDRLEGLFRYAAEHDMFVHLSTLFVMQGSIVSQTDCVKKLTDMPVEQRPRLRETLCDLPRRMKAQNPLTSVWEYRYIYKAIMTLADDITFNRFVPGAEEAIYSAFHRLHPRNPGAYLRKFWLSFDEVIKGIFLSRGQDLWIETPPGRITYRAVWCRTRPDGNLSVVCGPMEHAILGEGFILSTRHLSEPFENMLFEVLFQEPTGVAEGANPRISPVPPAEVTPSLLVREAFLAEDEDLVARRLVESQEPIVIWCAGLRTLQLLSNTSLGQANIRMIIDGNPGRQGQPFCGWTIQAPADLRDFAGKILVIHASCPERVEQQLRRDGITNEILIL